MLSVRNKIILISFLIASSFLSTFKLLLQTYDHRSTFANLENMKLEKEELSFQSNILLEEVKYFKNQISLRKFASENLGMTIPNNKESTFLIRSSN
mgnify:CR=1 FL=1